MTPKTSPAAGCVWRPDGGAQTEPDSAVELGGLIGVPAGSEDGPVPVPVLGVRQTQDVRERGDGIGAVEGDAYEFVEDSGAFPRAARSP